MGRWTPMVGFALALAAWIVVTTALSFRKRLRQTRAHWGMALAHLGVAVFVVGVTLVKGYEAERDAGMRPGDTLTLGGYAFRLDSVGPATGPNYRGARAQVTVTRDGRPVAVLHPERRIYTVQEQTMTEAAIDSGVTRDLYVSLGDPLEGGAWLVKAQVKPFIDWIWAGCVLMALGGLVAASDRRYRVPMAARREERAAEAAA
jgi:cytochrome c-type biogenesis protein CcmF